MDNVQTAIKKMQHADWQRIGLWVLAVGIVWPTQYLIVAPIVTLGAFAWSVVKFAVKVGVVGIVLLFVPIIGWAILAVWLIVRSSNKRSEIEQANAERRHREQMAAITGVEPVAMPEDGPPLWHTIWIPWLKRQLF